MNILTMVIVFTALQIINVILNTAKSLIMARTDNPHISALINAVTFGFYVAVVQQISQLDLTISIIVTVITNVIGVYLTYWIANKFKKDSLWKVEIYAPLNQYCDQADELKKGLDRQAIPYTQNAKDILTAYCYTQDHSRAVAEIIKELPSVKYNITEITKRF